jgi:hypothetical protein
VACIAVVLTVFHTRADRQRRAIQVVKQFNGTASYEYNRHPSTNRTPRWWDDYFCPITQVVLNDTNIGDDDLAKLTSLTHLRVLMLQNTATTDHAIRYFQAWGELEWVDLKGTHVSDEVADQLRRKFPDCEIETHWMRGCGQCRKPFLTRDIDIVTCTTCEQQLAELPDEREPTQRSRVLRPISNSTQLPDR